MQLIFQLGEIKVIFFCGFLQFLISKGHVKLQTYVKLHVRETKLL